MIAAFQKKTLSKKKRVCLRLHDARIACGMTIDTLAKKTKINKQYLEALECCRYDLLPKAFIYRKNFIRSYLEALGINPIPYVHQYVIEENISQQSFPHLPQQHLKRQLFRNIPSLMKYVITTLIILVIGSYLGLQVNHILEPPQLTILNPPPKYITNQPNITIQGTSSPEAKILVNGQPVSNKNNGKFIQSLNLSPGVNTILVSAQNKHDKITKKTIHIIFQQNQSLSFLP